MNYSKPPLLATELIRCYCFENPNQLDIEELAFAENLVVRESSSSNFYGRLIHNGSSGIIRVSQSIKDQGTRRFTIAHEMGHFFNERYIRKTTNYDQPIRELSSCVENDFNTFFKLKIRETRANEFAAELLLYKPWFSDFVRNRKINMELIKELAEYFNVSLTAAAIRYSEIGKYPVAVIMSQDGKVKWSVINEHFPYKWIQSGYKLREESSAFDYFAGKEVQTCDDLVPAHTWFSTDFNCPKDVYLNEQNVVMPNYKSVLTLLWEVK